MIWLWILIGVVIGVAGLSLAIVIVVAWYARDVIREFWKAYKSR